MGRGAVRRCLCGLRRSRALGPAATTAAGKRYLEEILSVGGSRPALESFTAFRGREPSIDALLRHSGMAA
jgi:oligopeptidase A